MLGFMGSQRVGHNKLGFVRSYKQLPAIKRQSLKEVSFSWAFVLIRHKYMKKASIGTLNLFTENSQKTLLKE